MSLTPNQIHQDMNNNLSEQHKRELIMKYVIPALGDILCKDAGFIELLIQHCRLIPALKYQELEAPGIFDDARAWFSIDAMVHSYYYCSHKFVKKGTRIWLKRQLIFFTSCLLKNETRTDYLQILEPGTLISIRYTHLLDLVNRYTELKKQINLVSVNNERQYHHRNLLLNKPAIERVREFEKENQLFTKLASREVMASHVGLTRQGYNLQLKKIRDKGKH